MAGDALSAEGEARPEPRARDARRQAVRQRVRDEDEGNGALRGAAAPPLRDRLPAVRAVEDPRAARHRPVQGATSRGRSAGSVRTLTADPLAERPEPRLPAASARHPPSSEPRSQATSRQPPFAPSETSITRSLTPSPSRSVRTGREAASMPSASKGKPRSGLPLARSPKTRM